MAREKLTAMDVDSAEFMACSKDVVIEVMSLSSRFRTKRDEHVDIWL